VRCRPNPAADVPGFQFYHDQYGPIIARCLHCRIGLAVTNENAAAVKWAMIVHLQYAHPDCQCR
jgi:hypothetical protein